MNKSPLLIVSLLLLLDLHPCMAPPQELCVKVKTLLSNAFDSIKDLTDQARVDLWRHSLRGLAYEILQEYKQTNNWKEIDDSLKLIREKMQIYQQYSKEDTGQIQRDIDQLEQTQQEKLEQHLQESYEYSSLNEENETLKLELSRLAVDIKRKYPNIQKEIKDLTTLNGVSIQMQRPEIPNSVLSTSLLHLRKILSKDGTELEKDILKAVSSMKHIDALRQAKSTKEFIMKTLERDLKKTNFSPINKLETTLENIKAEFMEKVFEELISEISTRKKVLFQKKQYKEFFAKKRRLAENKAKLNELTVGISALSKEIESLQKQIEKSRWKTRRISADQVSRLDSVIKNFDTAINGVNDLNTFGYLKAKQSIEQVTALLQEHKQDLVELSKAKQETEKIKGLLESVLQEEKKLDEHLARIFALVYMYRDPQTDSLKMCFTNKELSLYVFYMSVSQMIVSKTSFVEVLLENIQSKNRAQLVRSLFSEYLDREYMATQFPSSDYDTEGIQETSKTFALVLNSQLSEIFKQNESNTQYGWFGKILKYLGIDKSSIFEVARDTAYNMYMTNVSMAFLTLLTLSSGSVFFVALTTTFLCYLSNTVLDWISTLSEESGTKARQEYLDMLASVYSKISRSDSYDLDTDSDLTPVISGDGTSLFQNMRHSADEQVQFFSSVFESIGENRGDSFEMHVSSRIRLI